MSPNTDTAVIPLNGAFLSYTQTHPTATETIVMLHAGICDQRMWKAQVAHFGERYHVVTLDLYGFGQSTTPTQPFVYHQDIVTLLDQLHVEKAWVMACSLGGAIAFDVALMHPERVQGLVMVAPAVEGYEYAGDPHPLAAQIDAAEEAGDLNRVNELEIQMWVAGEGRTFADLAPEVRELALDMNRIALATDDSFWEHEEEIDPPAFDRLAEITMPVLLVGGVLDVPKSLARLDAIHDRLPHAQKVMMDNTAHLPSLERPAVFNQHVDAFLAEHKFASSP